MALTKIVDGVVIDLTAEEIAEIEARVAAADLDFNGVRNQRNGFLRNSDWTQLADSPVDSTLWVAYRQELRDLPAAYSRVSEVVWPTPPE
jgi:hypothetical protein|tara:strand:- start:1464 stop:1733 length:270 start_codon:yes stop_codon:yes gene_type:complete